MGPPTTPPRSKSNQVHPAPTEPLPPIAASNPSATPTTTAPTPGFSTPTASPGTASIPPTATASPAAMTATATPAVVETDLDASGQPPAADNNSSNCCTTIDMAPSGPPATDAAAAMRGVSLTFEDLTFSVTNTALTATLKGLPQGTTEILRGVTGYTLPGEVCALIGPSGAGKSTLLDMLSLRIPTDSEGAGGRISVNGQPLTLEYFKQHCAYVPQEDQLWGSLTVRENLDYACKLYGAADMTDAEREARVSDVIARLGLESCQHTRVGSAYLKGISGGQKRRTSIGVELVGKPSLLILDEPTSGLDAAAAAGIMDLLKEIALAFSLTIVCSIHQPASNIYLSFDSVMLLTQGQVAFFGKAASAMAYFERHGFPCPPSFNPADHLLLLTNADFASAEQVQAVRKAWADSPEAAAVEQAVNLIVRQGRASVGQIALIADHEQGLSAASKAGVLVRRILGNYQRDPGAYLSRVVLHIFMSVFLGTIYVNISMSQKDVLNRTFLIEWMIAFFSYMTISAVPTFALEKAVVEKEIANGQYQAGAYCLANFLVQLPLVFLLAVLGLTPAYWIASIRTDDTDAFFLMLLALFAFLVIIESLAVLIGTLISNFVVGLIVGNSILSVFFVTNNFFIPIDRLPDFWKFLIYISPYRFAGDMMLHTAFDGTFYDDYQACLNDTTTVCYGETGSQILTSLVDEDLATLDYGAWLAVLVATTLVLRVAVFLVLRRRI